MMGIIEDYSLLFRMVKYFDDHFISLEDFLEGDASFTKEEVKEIRQILKRGV